MQNIFDSIWKSKFALPIGVVAMASVGVLGISHYKIGQTASVVAASCSLQSDVDNSVSDKQNLESQLSDANTELQQINDNLVLSANDISDTQKEVTALTGTLISDYVINQKKVLVDGAYAELNERKAIDVVLAQYDVKSKEVASLLQTATALTASIDETYAMLTKLTAQKGAKASLESQAAFVKTTHDAQEILLQQIPDKKKIEAANLAVTKAPKNLPVYTTALQNYNALVKQYNSKYTKYLTMDSVGLANTYIANDRTYVTALSGLEKSTASYNAIYKNDTRTAAELTTSYNAMAKKYADMKQQKITMNTQLAKITAEKIPLSNKVTTLANAYKTKYKYKSIPDTAAVQKKNDTVSQEYNDLQTKNAAIKAKIDEANSKIETVNAKITDLNARATTLNDSITTLTGQISDLETLISNEQNNMCPANENSCSDGIDNDRDGIQDCDDSDCAEDSACKPVTPEICNNGVDDDNNGYYDCMDSACSGTSECQVVTPEVCGNGVDDDNNGMTDCSDAACASNPSCQNTTEVCGNGVDDDNNGATDCSDGACSSDPSCHTVVRENCSNGMDDDNNGMTDCADSACSSDANCRTNNSEMCGNGVDDDNNGATDCGDPACINDPSCTTVRIDDDKIIITKSEICGNGIDDDGNGTADCGDSACSGNSACTCQIKDINGVVLGSCDDFGVTNQDEFNNSTDINGANGGSVGLVNKPSECPKGSSAQVVGQARDLGVVLYKCVKVQDGEDFQETCGNGKIDAGEDCEVGTSVSNGQCVSCSISCDAGYSRTKTFWSSILPGNDSYKCSAYTVNEGSACGNSYGSCTNGDLDQTRTNAQEAVDRSQYWFCGSTKCPN